MKPLAFGKRELIVGTGTALTSALLAMLLDLAIEPAAAHVVFYWLWLALGSFHDYGVPLSNFVVWFGVAFVLLLLAEWLLRGWNTQKIPQYKQSIWWQQRKVGVVERLIMFVPCLLFLYR